MKQNLKILKIFLWCHELFPNEIITNVKITKVIFLKLRKNAERINPKRPFLPSPSITGGRGRGLSPSPSFAAG
jgi:hypothetical protein